MPSFRAPKEPVMRSLRSTERLLAKDPERAMAYSTEILKLIQAGSASKLGFSALNNEGELWYIPHHVWPVKPNTQLEEEASELQKTTFCGVTSDVAGPQAPHINQCNTWKELREVTAQALHGVAGQGPRPTASNYQKAETLILQRAQEDSFPDELRLLKAGKPIQSSSRLITLSPELDESGELIRVGGRLRRD
ncbi:hypothetical protein AAFF_G00114850 [Aldrovandia affinis]|uniref:Uncharacterized protein n=1 Tax=Aldrovandia affinis TaxID=143900 RepID=A0AAD7RSW4_9TELE|nr:hypothetical protein AAFF_G00114850 [Aldrovandia affinis]